MITLNNICKGAPLAFMSDSTGPTFSLNREPSVLQSGALLFRTEANRHAQTQALGSPSIVMPPTSTATVALAVVLVSLLAAASWLVEIPQVVRGSGVIMPGDGFVPVAASAQGRVTHVLVNEKQRVSKGDVLIRLSGADAAGDDSLARLKLKSLEHEMELRRQGHEQREAASSQRVALIDSRVATLQRQTAALRRERAARKDSTEITERRVRRAAQLLDSGSMSPDQLDRVKESAVDARIAVFGLQNRITQLLADKEAATTEREAEATNLNLQSLEYAVALEQLQRQIKSAQLKLARDVIAVQDSVVSRVRVVVGESVQQGQPLILLRTGDAELEAWFYVATGSGGTVRPGQSISLRIDAFPHQIYGTQKAIVETVSAIALRPAELRVPLAINEPVFEVRARLLSKEIVASNNRWPLIAGLSFQADVVQDKYRLYRWLMRHVLPSDNATDG